MKSKSLNKNLHNAKNSKKDEFYTQLTDIEKEMVHYKKYFRGKTVFCNCDDPVESNFWQYFSLNFEHLGLKKLISTHYETDQPTYKLEITADRNSDGKINGLDTVKTPLQQNGDFRSPECIEIMEESDIVTTNPPFSLFREYVAQLVEYKKKFIILGNMNAIIYKEIFPLIKDNKMWLGNNNGPKKYLVPDTFEGKSIVVIDGKRYMPMGNTNWFTNLKHNKRNENLILYKKYDPKEYPKYDNYDAINVNKVKDIPMDYDGIMGVPITFLDKYNPKQFEIMGAIQRNCHDLVPDTRKYNDYWEVRQDGSKTGSSGNKTNENPNLLGNDGRKNYFINKEGRIIQSCYQRIFIRNRNPQQE